MNHKSGISSVEIDAIQQSVDSGYDGIEGVGGVAAQFEIVFDFPKY